MIEILSLIPPMLIGWNFNWLLGAFYIIFIGYYLFNKGSDLSAGSFILGFVNVSFILLNIVILLSSISISRSFEVDVLFNEIESLIIIISIIILYTFYNVYVKKYYNIENINYKKVGSLAILILIFLSIIIPLITII